MRLRLIPRIIIQSSRLLVTAAIWGVSWRHLGHCWCDECVGMVLSRSICDDQVQKMCLKGRSFVENKLWALSAGDSDRRFRGQALSTSMYDLYVKVDVKVSNVAFAPLFPFVCSFFQAEKTSCLFLMKSDLRCYDDWYVRYWDIKGTADKRLLTLAQVSLSSINPC